MSQNSYPNNVPDANKGASDSVAAPGCVGVRGTNWKSKVREDWGFVQPVLARFTLECIGLVLYLLLYLGVPVALFFVVFITSARYLGIEL